MLRGRSGTLVLAALAVLVARPSVAQEGIFAGMQKGVDLAFASVETITTSATGAMTKTRTRSVFPALTLNIDSLIYPALRLNAGGVFELNVQSTNIEGRDLDSTITRNRPFFVLRSTSPVFAPGIGYFRREERARVSGGSDIKLVNDEVSGYLGWNPAGGPRTDFQVVRTHTFDGTRAYQDITKLFGSALSSYTNRNLAVHYRGSYLDTDDGINRLQTRQVIHGARITDSESLLGQRLQWNGAYHINYRDVTTAAEGDGGEVSLPVNPFAGLSALSDVPGTARLSQNALLIDANLTASAGVDLGVAVPPDNVQPRNIGIDFLNRAEVNRITVWVDRDLPLEVARAFTWEIYSSQDNVIWRRDATVAAAPFDPFEHRFEIDFPGIVTRYVKVVTRPLSAAVPDASRFADIFVTEIQAFLRQPAGDAATRLTQTTHLVNSDVRMRILDAPAFYYEGFVFYNGPDTLGTSTTTVSNGFSANHSFARIFSVYGRAARELGWEPRGDRTATVTNATLTVDPIPTFRSSLLYTGQDETVDGLRTDRRGIFLQNSARPYRGVDLLFGFGWNALTNENGEDVTDRFLNVSATVVPRAHVTLTVSYDDRITEPSGTASGLLETHTRRLYTTVAVDPVRTLHLLVGHEVFASSLDETRTAVDIVASWAPFPDGALQIVFAHNEARRSLQIGQDRSTVGSVRWNFTARSYLDVSVQRIRSEFTVLTTESRIFSVNLRLFV